MISMAVAGVLCSRNFLHAHTRVIQKAMQREELGVLVEVQGVLVVLEVGLKTLLLSEHAMKGLQWSNSGCILGLLSLNPLSACLLLR